MITGESLPLHGHPKEVQDSVFSGISDTNIHLAKGKYEYSETSQFNNEGDRLYYSWYAAALATEIKTKYTDTGLLQITTNYVDGKPMDSSVTSVFPFREGLFKETMTNRKKSLLKLISFNDDGNIKIIETIDSFQSKVVRSVQKEFYKESRLQKISSLVNQSQQEVLYYYSGNALDSIIVLVDGRLQMKTVYKNNDKGDPVFRASITGGDTARAFSISYVYDEKGNWKRKLEKELIKPGYHPDPLNSFMPKFQGQTLTIRKLIYN